MGGIDWRQFFHETLNHGFQGERHKMNRRLAAGEIREGQQGTGQGNEPPDLLKIVEEGFAIFLRGPDFHEGDIQVALQDGQGGLHFVGAMSQNLR